MQKISTFLWFDRNADEAAQHYVSIFKNSKVVATSRYGEGAPLPAGTTMVVHFQLEGQDFFAMNGGSGHPFTDAISLAINCETQAEIDDLWARLASGGGEPGPCGWVKDKFGLWWQVWPATIIAMLTGDPARAARVHAAVLEMGKLDLARLKAAYEGK